MSFGNLHEEADGEVMAEINMTPLVDVMLVLLIIFIVTMPVIHHAVRLDLPKANSQQLDTKPERVRLSIAADGALSWDEHGLAVDELEARLQAASSRNPAPVLELQADRRTPYDHVAQVLAAAHRHNLTQVSFVTQAGHAP